MSSHQDDPQTDVSPSSSEMEVTEPLVFGPTGTDPAAVTAWTDIIDDIDATDGVLSIQPDDIVAHGPDGLINEVINIPDELLYHLTQAARERDGEDIDIDLYGELPGVHKNLEDIRANDLGSLVSVDVRVTDRTEQYPLVRLGAFRCDDCGSYTERWQPRSPGKAERPNSCYDCDAGKRALSLDKQRSELVDSQEVLVQDLHTRTDSPNPTDLRAVLHNRHVGTIEPGESVTITAIVRTDENDEKSSDLWLQVVGIEHHDEDFSAVELTDEDIEEIKTIAESDDVFSRLSASIAPSGAGIPELARRALLFQLVGGVSHATPGEKDRKNIHIAFVGDPGTYKSSLGRFVANVAPNGVYASADGASKVGITAAVQHEERFNTSKYTISGGALVRADKGLCVIDELDKAKDAVKESLQEPLSEQQVSVEKVIEATLPARSSVLLIANPDSGRFDLSRPLADQIDINPVIWSRMDIILPFIDRPDKEKDRVVADSILDKASGQSGDYLSPEQIRKYVAYCREHIVPTLPDDSEAKEYLADKYATMRSNGAHGAVPIGARQIEGLVRLAEASARLRLSETVEMEDAERAVDMMTDWMSLMATDSSGHFDIDRVSTEPASKREKMGMMFSVVDELDEGEGALRNDVVDAMTEDERISKEDAQQTINAATGRGDINYDKDSGRLSRGDSA